LKHLIITALLLLFSIPADAGEMLGKPAPDFTLADLRTGEMVNLSDFAGQIVVLQIWRACKGKCRAAVPHFKRLQREFPSDLSEDSITAGKQRKPALKILSVNAIDFKKAIASEARKLGMDYQILVGRKSRITKLYKTIVLPQVYIIDPSGIIRHVTMYPDYDELRKVIDELYAAFAEADSGH